MPPAADREPVRPWRSRRPCDRLLLVELVGGAWWRRKQRARSGYAAERALRSKPARSQYQAFHASGARVHRRRVGEIAERSLYADHARRLFPRLPVGLRCSPIGDGSVLLSDRQEDLSRHGILRRAL